MRRAAAIVLALALPLSATAEPATPITKIETRSLPASEVSKRVMEQLSRIVTLSPDPNAQPRPAMPLSQLSFWTKPRATFITGLCAADGMTVSFRYTELAAGAATPVEADGVVAKTYYHFLDWPKDYARHDRSPEQVAQDEDACARFDPDKVRMIEASDESDVAEGAWLFGEIVRRAADLRDSFDCTEDPRYGIPQCRKRLATLRREDISNIGRCDIEGKGDGHCLTVFVEGEDLKLFITVGSNSGVAAVEVHQMMSSHDPLGD